MPSAAKRKKEWLEMLVYLSSIQRGTQESCRKSTGLIVGGSIPRMQTHLRLDTYAGVKQIIIRTCTRNRIVVSREFDGRTIETPNALCYNRDFRPQ